MPATEQRPKSSLKETAEREAAEAEKEAAEKEATEVQLKTDVEPGEQGIATQEEEPSAEYVAPEPSEEQVAAAREVLAQLEDRVREYGPERTVDALMQVIDVLPEFTTPEEWPLDEEDEYAEAALVGRIGSFLLRGCSKLKLSPKHVVWLWRNREKWTSKGRTVRGAALTLNTRARFLTDGKKAVIEVNFQHWKTLNPQQRVLVVYHELRCLDAEGKTVAPDFEGFNDELEIFGTRTFREMVALETAVQRGAERELQYSLSLLEAEDGGEEKQAA